MLDWLKVILGDAYTEEIDTKVSAEIGKSFVPRADFNAVNEAKKTLDTTLKERDKQLEDLKAATGDADALKKTIADLQAANATQAKENAAALNALKIDAAVDIALVTAKAKNTKAVKALLDLSKAELAEDGTVKGLSDQLAALAKAEDSAFLFDTDQQGGASSFSGLTPGQGSGTPGAAGGTGAKALKDMSYDELCDYLAKNPTAQLT